MICTEWEESRQLDWERVGNLMARRLVIDGRNLCSPGRMRDFDFEYFSFGRELVRGGGEVAFWCQRVGILHLAFSLYRVSAAYAEPTA